MAIMTEKWVQDQLAILTPPVGWELDSGAALTRLHARADQRRPPRAWLRWAAVAGLAVAAFLLHPAGRALSDVIWQLLTVPHRRERGRLDARETRLRPVRQRPPISA